MKRQLFKRPGAAAKLRLLEALAAMGNAPNDPALHCAFWTELAALRSVPVDRGLVAFVRATLAPSDPVHSWPIEAHWAALRVGDTKRLTQIIRKLCM